MTKHCMIDLETLGVNSQSPITQIGIVMFDETKIIEKKNVAIKFDQAFNDGVADASTVKWWMEQGSEAKAAALAGTTDIMEAARTVQSFILSHGPEFFWSHATFDFPILTSWFNRRGLITPINFLSCRDVRTIEHFFSNMIVWEARKGTHHSAVDDAEFQAEMVIRMLKAAKMLGKVEI